jgi:hypothetical protein
LSASFSGLVVQWFKFREISSCQVGISPTSKQTGLTICVVACIFSQNTEQVSAGKKVPNHFDHCESPAPAAALGEWSLVCLIKHPQSPIQLAGRSTGRYLQQLGIYSGVAFGHPVLASYGQS